MPSTEPSRSYGRGSSCRELFHHGRPKEMECREFCCVCGHRGLSDCPRACRLGQYGSIWDLPKGLNFRLPLLWLECFLGTRRSLFLWSLSCPSCIKGWGRSPVSQRCHSYGGMRWSCIDQLPCSWPTRKWIWLPFRSLLLREANHFEIWGSRCMSPWTKRGIVLWQGG